MEYIKDIWNPSQHEIRTWAFDTDALCEQDWELAIAEFRNFDLMIELANNTILSKRKFFLGCLYVFVGDIVRSKELFAKTNLQFLIENLKDEEMDFDLKSWKDRSLEILTDDNLYTYDFWGLGSKYVYI